MSKVMEYVKAVGGAVASLVAVALFVWRDKSVSLDEMNALWLAVIPVLTAIGIIASPKNRQPS